MSDPVRILGGDVRESLRQLPDESVHMVCTSPPYYALRSYLPKDHPLKHLEIGLEPTLEEYIETMVDVFREVRRVLRKDGVAWLNLGDVYAFGARGGNPGHSPHVKQRSNVGSLGVRGLRPNAKGSKPKDLIGVPWKVAFALQADGWWLRSECIWHKISAMPESVRDRPTRSHEHVFLFARSKRYFYDADAVMTPDRGGDHRRTMVAPEPSAVPGASPHRGIRTADGRNGAGANLRSVWSIATRPYAGEHYAVFPPEIPNVCIRAGTSERGCCADCGTPWKRLTRVVGRASSGGGSRAMAAIRPQQGDGAFVTGEWNVRETIGWAPTCKCGTTETKPCVVLDPFGGTGVTAAVAVTLGRHAIMCELNPHSIELTRERLGLFAPRQRAVDT